MCSVPRLRSTLFFFFTRRAISRAGNRVLNDEEDPWKTPEGRPVGSPPNCFTQHGSQWHVAPALPLAVVGWLMMIGVNGVLGLKAIRLIA